MTTPAALKKALAPNYCIKAGYRSRLEPEYFTDALDTECGVLHQPDVYPFAAYLADRYACGHLVDLGCGRGTKLVPFASRFRVVGVDFGENARRCREETGLDVMEWDLARVGRIPIPEEIAADSVVICADVIEHLVDPVPLLENLARLAQRAAAVVVSTPERDRARGTEDMGPPANPAHVREWAFTELIELFRKAGLPPSFCGLSRSNNRESAKRTTLLCVADVLPRSSPSKDFDVLAVLPVYNEEDIIAPVARTLLNQGVRLRVIDNWCTDRTVDRLRGLEAGDRIRIERVPCDGPPEHFEWSRLLERVEEISAEERADWVIFQSADEVLRPPWPGTGLRKALWTVQELGFSAVDHTVLDFRPVNERPYDGSDPEERFSYFEFPGRPGSFVQIKAWRRGKVSLAASGGHEACFEGRRVFPYKFLLKHYPIRSPAHGRRKVLQERKARWSPEEREWGWHVQYDALDEASSFVWSAEDLVLFDETEFNRDYVVERLSGVGIRQSA